jgi:serine/threonine protein phosphatase PrpC
MRRVLVQESGTTATVVFICGPHVITGNVGDSLAYLDVGACVQQLTSNHRIDDNLAEQKRITDSGALESNAARQHA